MPVSLRDARTQAPDREWLRAVYRQYLAELSASHTGMFPMLGDWDAREHEFLAAWFADPGTHPFVILADGERVGFALVTRPPALPRNDVQYRMAEFFVVEGVRRRGIGASAASLLFNRFAGQWEVLEDELNRPALDFWRRVIARATDGRYSESRTGGEIRHRFRTEARPEQKRIADSG